jgi:hypothetical protein
MSDVGVVQAGGGPKLARGEFQWGRTLLLAAGIVNTQPVEHLTLFVVQALSLLLMTKASFHG